jgi:hypothetical protein
MACSCKDFDGEPSKRCMGVCDAANERCIKMLEGEKLAPTNQYDWQTMEHALSQYLVKLDMRIEKLQQMMREQRTEGFKEGFEFAREIYE